MHDMTVTNLRSAFGGECMAQIRYMLWNLLTIRGAANAGETTDRAG